MKKYRYERQPLTIREYAVVVTGVVLAVVVCLGSQMGDLRAFPFNCRCIEARRIKFASVATLAVVPQ